MRNGLIAILVAVAWVLPSASFADEEAERIRAGLLSILGGGASEAPALSEVDVLVRPDGESYAVSVTGIRLPGAGDSWQALGEIAFRVRKQGQDYAFDQVRLPDRISAVLPLKELIEQADLAVAPSTLDLQVGWSSLSLSGLWSSDLQLLTDLDLSIRDMVWEGRVPGLVQGADGDGRFDFSYASVDLSYATDRTNATAWNMAGGLKIGPIKGRFPADLSDGMLFAPSAELRDKMGLPEVLVAALSLDSYRLDWTTNGFNPESYRKLKGSLTDYVAAAEAGDVPALSRLGEEVLGLDRVLHGADLRWDLRGFSYAEDWPGGMVYDEEFQTGHGGFEVPAGSDTARISYVGSGDGTLARREGLDRIYELSKGATSDQDLQDTLLAFLPLSLKLELLVPTKSDITLSIERIPVRQTSALALKGLAHAVAEAEEERGAQPIDLSALAPQAVAEWLAALQAARTRIHLERLSGEGPLLWFAGKADVEVEAESRSGVVGSAELTLSDVDKAMKAAREQVAATLGVGASGGKGLGGQVDAAITLGIAFLKGLGDPAAENGEIVYHYRFDLPPDGPATLNGKPLSTLLGQ